MTIKHDIVVQKGADFQLNIAAQNSDRTVKDLTGWTAKMQVRTAPGAADPPLLTAGTADGRITINAPGGIVMVDVPASVTEAMTWQSGVWDLEITNAGGTQTIRLAEGFASLSLEVTV